MKKRELFGFIVVMLLALFIGSLIGYASGKDDSYYKNYYDSYVIMRENMAVFCKTFDNIAKTFSENMSKDSYLTIHKCVNGIDDVKEVNIYGTK